MESQVLIKLHPVLDPKHPGYVLNIAWIIPLLLVNEALHGEGNLEVNLAQIDPLIEIKVAQIVELADVRAASGHHVHQLERAVEQHEHENQQGHDATAYSTDFQVASDVEGGYGTAEHVNRLHKIAATA